MPRINLNADLGEGYGPWTMGDDAAMLAIVNSANVACGGHAGDPDVMRLTLRLAQEHGVSIAAHPDGQRLTADFDALATEPTPARA